MTDSLCFPFDELTGSSIDYDRAADYLELTAFFAEDSTALTSDLISQAEIGAEDDHAYLHQELQSGQEDLVNSTVNRIEDRRETLGSTAYPFNLDARGDYLTCNLVQDSFGHAAYVLSLVLSNLSAVSPVLGGSRMHPSEQEVRRLREYFQFFATAAMASEIQGSAWSFGFPRPDSSGFLDKLRKIWLTLGDGLVERQTGAPLQPKDDQVDVFAARQHPDRLPGFPLAAAQVATGNNARGKSLQGHLSAFKSRWFSPQPVTAFMAYMVMPFAVADDDFLDDVRTMGNVLHRLRVPRGVVQAAELLQTGETIEGYDRLEEAAQWVVEYRARVRAPA